MANSRQFKELISDRDYVAAYSQWVSADVGKRMLDALEGYAAEAAVGIGHTHGVDAAYYVRFGAEMLLETMRVVPELAKAKQEAPQEIEPSYGFEQFLNPVLPNK